MTERLPLGTLWLVAGLVSSVYTLIPRPTESPPERQMLPPEHQVGSGLWNLIDALGPLAASDSSEIWELEDTLEVFNNGEEDLHRVLRRWNANFHRCRHALPGDEGPEEEGGPA